MVSEETYTQRVVGHAIATDDILIAEARQLAHDAIQVAHRHLRYGSPQTQLSVLRALMPAIGRAVARRDESEEMLQMRRELQAVNQALLAE